MSTEERAPIARYVTLTNAVVSGTILTFLLIFYSMNIHEKSNLQIPIETYEYSLVRSTENSGIFDHQKVTLANYVPTLTAAERKKAFLNQLECPNEDAAPRCKCYCAVYDKEDLETESSYNDKKSKIPKMVTEKCFEFSGAWDIEIADEPSQVLLGAIAWWGLATSLLFTYEWLHNITKDHLYAFVYFVLMLTPVSVTLWQLYEYEGLGMWFWLTVAFSGLFLFLRAVSWSSMRFRDDENKKDMQLEYDRKILMGVLTGFALSVTARMALLFSGDTNSIDTENITFAAIAVGMHSIAVRLMCAGLHPDDEKNVNKNGTLFSARWRYVIY